MSDPSALEADVRARLATGDVAGATTAILRALGPEVLGFLVATTRDPTAASDAFSDLSVDLWKGLPGFAWRASLRTWVYALARNAAHRTARPRVADRAEPLSGLEEVVAQVRESTLPYLRSEVQDGVAALRNDLDPEEQELLILRVDRDMAWRDIAAVLAPDGDPTREAAALRKRFERVKAKLRAAAERAGLR